MWPEGGVHHPGRKYYTSHDPCGADPGLMVSLYVPTVTQRSIHIHSSACAQCSTWYSESIGYSRVLLVATVACEYVFSDV
jgi:hypothetical protein